MIEKTKLPKGWEVKKLSEVCLKVQTVKRKEKKLDEELLYLDIGGIDNLTNVVLSHKNFIWENAPSRAQQIVHLDDILFSTVRTYMKNIAIVNNQIYDGQIASSGFCVIRANKEIINPKFIFYYSLSHKFLQPLNELQTGSSYPAIRDKDVFSQPFPYPPLSEQTAIVAKIEELLSDLENGKQQLLTAQGQLKVYRQSLLNTIVTGKNCQSIESVINKLDQGWSPKCLNEYSINENEWAVIKTSAVQNGHFMAHENKVLPTNLKPREQHELKMGDILITRAGPRIRVGVCCMIKSTRPKLINSDKVYRIKVNIKMVKPEYFELVLNTPFYQREIEKMKSGISDSGLNLTQSKFLKIEIPIPPIDEQNRIIEELESKLTICDKIEETISQSLAQSETLRQSILKKAFEGQLV